MATIEIDGNSYDVIGYDKNDGLPILKAIITTTEHKDEDGNQIFDEDGHPKISVHVQVPGPPTGITPGQVT